MSILIFGNPEIPNDSLPIRLLPKLRVALPQLDFIHLDPNEEFTADGDVTVIDTVVGLVEPRVFASLDEFSVAPRLTTHDFDAYAQLRWLQKLGALTSIAVIGLPPATDETTALSFVMVALTAPPA